MAASKTRRPRSGFTRFTRQHQTLVAGALYPGQVPAGLILQDGDGNDWYLWFDNTGTLKFGDAVTVENPAFNFATGGGATNAKVVTIDLNATSVDKYVFIADSGYKVTSVREVHSTAGGAAAAVRPRKITDTSPPGAVASATVKELTLVTIDLTATVGVVTTPALSGTPADLILAAGDKIALDFNGTLTGLVGTLQIMLVPQG